MAKNYVIATPSATATAKTNTTITGEGSIKTVPAPKTPSAGGASVPQPSTVESGTGAMNPGAGGNAMTKSRPTAKVTTDGTNWSTLDEFTNGAGAQTAPTADNIPVRRTLNYYGVSDDRIGYDDATGYVTLDGQNFMRPAQNRDYTTYDTAENIDAAWRQYAQNNGLYGIRDTFGARDIEHMLGWNDATNSVTVGGVDAYTPLYNADGTTYADAATVNRLTNLAYERSGDPLMGARAYMDRLGLPGSVIWDGESGTVNIGGMALKPVYVADGIAYIPKSQLDAAAEAYKEQTGIRTPRGVLSDYEGKYGDRTDRALRALEEREPYSFDPSTNPLYQQYVKEKQRQANEAYEQVLNDNNTSVYGASGAVLAEAFAAKNRYLDDLAGDWERLEGMAYNRYNDDTARMRNNLSDVLTVGDNYYGKLYQSDADAYSRSRAGAQDTINAYQQQFENEQTAAANAAANAYTAMQTAGMDIANRKSLYDYNTYPEERRLYLEGLAGTNRYNTAQTIEAELANEQLMSYNAGGIVTDDLTPNYAQIARALNYTPNAQGIYVDASGKPFNSIDAQRIYEGMIRRDDYNAKMGVFYPY